LNGYDVLTEGHKISDVQFLEKVLETREELYDASDDKEKLTKLSGKLYFCLKPSANLAERNQNEYREVIANLNANFQVANFEEAKKNTVSLQYITKILEEIENLLGYSIITVLNKQL
jgi:hypothetical protein